MNLLDSVLSTSRSQEYAGTFKKYKIDAFTLKLLNDDDLQLLGIKEEEKRTAILEQVANLQIPAEKHIDIVIDQKYILAVLAQMSVHLTKHVAAVGIAVKRQDVILCDLRLANAAHCLDSCVGSISRQLHEFEKQKTAKQKKRKNYKIVIGAPVILTTCLGLVTFKLLQYLNQ